MNRETLFAILDLLLIRTEERTDAGVVADSLGITRTESAQAVMQLHRKGLVEASTLRLTLRGLAAATALRSATHQARVAA